MHLKKKAKKVMSVWKEIKLRILEFRKIRGREGGRAGERDKEIKQERTLHTLYWAQRAALQCAWCPGLWWGETPRSPSACWCSHTTPSADGSCCAPGGNKKKTCLKIPDLALAEFGIYKSKKNYQNIQPKELSLYQPSPSLWNVLISDVILI